MAKGPKRPWFRDWRAALLAIGLVGLVTVGIGLTFFPTVQPRGVNQAAYEDALSALRRTFPDEVPGFTAAVLGSTGPPQVPEDQIEWAKGFYRRHTEELRRAPAEQIVALYQMQRTVAWEIASRDVASCAWGVTSRSAWVSDHPSGRSLVTLFDTAAMGRDFPVEHGAPTEQERALFRETLSDPEVLQVAEKIVPSFGRRKADVEKCREEVAFHEAIRRLPTSMVARLFADSLAPRPSGVP